MLLLPITLAIFDLLGGGRNGTSSAGWTFIPSPTGEASSATWSCTKCWPHCVAARLRAIRPWIEPSPEVSGLVGATTAEGLESSSTRRNSGVDDASATVYGQRRVLKTLVVNWVALGLVFALTAWALPGLSVTGGVLGYLWVAAIFGVINAIIGTLLRIVTFPLRAITFGLFSIVVNAVLIEITSRVTDNLTVDHFWFTAIWAAIIMACATVLLQLALRVLMR